MQCLGKVLVFMTAEGTVTCKWWIKTSGAANHLPCAGQLPTTKNHPAQNINGVEETLAR